VGEEEDEEMEYAPGQLCYKHNNSLELTVQMRLILMMETRMRMEGSSEVV